MKKLSVLLLCAALVCASCPGLALADSTAASINASIVSSTTHFVTAPFAGTLLPFTLEAGERVTAGDALFELDTVKVYAPQSGTLSAVFAAPGDAAADIIARYGALAVVEPELPLYVAASTSTADKDDEDKYLHAGETLYLKCGSEKGTGRVTSVSGNDYTVEILTGDFVPGDTVRCYRDSGHDSDSMTGSGKVQRYADSAVTGSGRVLRVHAQAGDAVRAGDLLFELVDAASAPPTDDCTVAAPADGAVLSVDVTPGAQVYQGQLLCRIADLTALELSAEVDEVYLSRLSVGDAVSFVMDAYPEETLTGVVTDIRPLGETRQNAAYFDVRISLPEGHSLLPGMNATVYLN